MRFQKVPGGRGSEVGDRRSGIGGRGSEVGDRRAEGGSRWLVFHWPVLQRRDGHFTFFSLHVLFLPLFGFGSLFHPTDVRQPALSFIWERAGGEGRAVKSFGTHGTDSTNVRRSLTENEHIPLPRRGGRRSLTGWWGYAGGYSNITAKKPPRPGGHPSTGGESRR